MGNKVQGPNRLANGIGIFLMVGAFAAVLGVATHTGTSAAARAEGNRDVASLVVLFVLLALGVVFYFLPVVVARVRHASHTVAIFWLTFFLGWTVLGWLAMVIWAVADEANADPTPRTRAASEVLP